MAPTIASSAINPTTTRTSTVSHKERLNLQAMIRVSKIRPTSSLSSSSSSVLFPSISRLANSRPQLVCMAKINAVSEDVNDSSWNDMVVGSKSPVLVEFGAPWCGPCRMIAPVIEELAKEYAGKIVCLKVNTDESPKTASKYGIRSLPTVLLFKSGEKKESVIGAVPKSTLCATLDKYVLEDI